MRRFFSSAKGLAATLCARGMHQYRFTAGVVLVVSVGATVAMNPTQAAQLPASSPRVYPKEFYSGLAAILMQSQIESDLEERKQRGKPWNSYHSSNDFPELILYPETTEQVSRIVKLCNKYNVPLVPFGGGTSLEGQTITTKAGGVSLDFNRMKKIIELNEDDLDVKVEAGIGYVELNEILKPKGLWFPLDPGPGASIGGKPRPSWWTTSSAHGCQNFADALLSFA